VIIYKQPIEKIPCVWDNAQEMPTGQTFQLTSSILVFDGLGNDTTPSMLVSTTISPTKIEAIIAGGVDGEQYDISFRGVTQDFVFENDIFLNVQEMRAQ
jgi:hypothetical protein